MIISNVNSTTICQMLELNASSNNRPHMSFHFKRNERTNYSLKITILCICEFASDLNTTYVSIIMRVFICQCILFCLWYFHKKKTNFVRVKKLITRVFAILHNFFVESYLIFLTVLQASFPNFCLFFHLQERDLTSSTGWRG